MDGMDRDGRGFGPRGRRVRALAVPGEVGSWPVGWVVLLAAVLPLSVVARGSGVLPGDVAVSRAVQGLDWPGIASGAAFFNAAGGASGTLIVTLLVCAALLAAGKRAAATLVIAALAIRVANPILKETIDSPRPTGELVRVTEQAGGFGFPSGHTMGVVLFWGMVFALAGGIGRRWLRWAVRTGAVLMMAAVGLSRIYTGAHWPSDVVGGVLWGTLLLVSLLRLDAALRGSGGPVSRWLGAPEPAPVGGLAITPHAGDGD